jgi:hypothetical protein
MAPAFLVMLVFLIGPVLYTLYASGTNMALTGVGAAAPQWIGLTNFVRILRDGAFYNALRVSLTYLVGSALIGQAVLGLLLALLMRRRHPIFKSVLGAIIVGAWTIPDVVGGVLWYAFLAGGPQSITTPGLLNSIVSTFGLPQYAWLQEYPMAAVIVANTWRGAASRCSCTPRRWKAFPPGCTRQLPSTEPASAYLAQTTGVQIAPGKIPPPWPPARPTLRRRKTKVAAEPERYEMHYQDETHLETNLDICRVGVGNGVSSVIRTMSSARPSWHAP